MRNFNKFKYTIIFNNVVRYLSSIDYTASVEKDATNSILQLTGVLINNSTIMNLTNTNNTSNMPVDTDIYQSVIDLLKKKTIFSVYHEWYALLIDPKIVKFTCVLYIYGSISMSIAEKLIAKYKLDVHITSLTRIINIIIKAYRELYPVIPKIRKFFAYFNKILPDTYNITLYIPSIRKQVCSVSYNVLDQKKAIWINLLHSLYHYCKLSTIQILKKKRIGIVSCKEGFATKQNEETIKAYNTSLYNIAKNHNIRSIFGLDNRENITLFMVDIIKHAQKCDLDLLLQIVKYSKNKKLITEINKYNNILRVIEGEYILWRHESIHIQETIYKKKVFIINKHILKCSKHHNIQKYLLRMLKTTSFCKKVIKEFKRYEKKKYKSKKKLAAFEHLYDLEIYKLKYYCLLIKQKYSMYKEWKKYKQIRLDLHNAFYSTGKTQILDNDIFGQDNMFIENQRYKLSIRRNKVLKKLNIFYNTTLGDKALYKHLHVWISQHVDIIDKLLLDIESYSDCTQPLEDILKSKYTLRHKI